MDDKKYGPPIKVLITDICSGHCFSCSTLSCETGYVMDPRELDVFLKNIEGYLPDKPVRLTGGEPTSVGNDLDTYSNIVLSHSRRLEILTNGDKLLSVDPKIFDRIILDEHIANRGHIDDLRRHLRELNHPDFIVYPMHHHQDLRTLIGKGVTPGPHCRAWMDTLTLMRGVLYPCCILPVLEKWDPSLTVTEDLRASGYTYDNPELPELIENWRDHIPDSVLRCCLLTCWRHDGQSKARWYPTHG